MRHRLLTGVVGLAFAVAFANALPATAATGRPTHTTAAAPQCELLGTVTATASTLQQTVEGQTGQQLPADLADVIGQIAAQAGCGGGDGRDGGGRPAPRAPGELCRLLGTVVSTAATLQQTAQAATGQQLPADLAGVIGQISTQAGCGDSRTEPTPSPGGEAHCQLFATLTSTAATIQQTVQAQTGQQLPADLTDVISQIARQVGCGDSAADGGGSPAPGPQCALFATLASTGATIQQTVQAQTGQQLPADLADVISQIAEQGGCSTQTDPGDTTTTTTTPPDGGSGSASGSGTATADTDGTDTSARVTAAGSGAAIDASLSGASTADGAQLPRTGQSLPYEALGGGFLAIAGLLQLVRRRLLSEP